MLINQVPEVLWAKLQLLRLTCIDLQSLNYADAEKVLENAAVYQPLIWLSTESTHQFIMSYRDGRGLFQHLDLAPLFETKESLKQLSRGGNKTLDWLMVHFHRTLLSLANERGETVYANEHMTPYFRHFPSMKVNSLLSSRESLIALHLLSFKNLNVTVRNQQEAQQALDENPDASAVVYFNQAPGAGLMVSYKTEAGEVHYFNCYEMLKDECFHKALLVGFDTSAKILKDYIHFNQYQYALIDDFAQLTGEGVQDVWQRIPLPKLLKAKSNQVLESRIEPQPASLTSR